METVSGVPTRTSVVSRSTSSSMLPRDSLYSTCGVTWKVVIVGPQKGNARLPEMIYVDTGK